MSKTTKMSTEEVIQRAKKYFVDELGLQIRDELHDCCVDFVGGTGFVTLQVTREDNKTQIKLSTSEWEYQIQAFLGKIR